NRDCGGGEAPAHGAGCEPVQGIDAPRLEQGDARGNDEKQVYQSAKEGMVAFQADCRQLFEMAVLALEGAVQDAQDQNPQKPADCQDRCADCQELYRPLEAIGHAQGPHDPECRNDQGGGVGPDFGQKAPYGAMAVIMRISVMA